MECLVGSVRGKPQIQWCIVLHVCYTVHICICVWLCICICICVCANSSECLCRERLRRAADDDCAKVVLGSIVMSCFLTHVCMWRAWCAHRWFAKRLSVALRCKSRSSTTKLDLIPCGVSFSVRCAHLCVHVFVCVCVCVCMCVSKYANVTSTKREFGVACHASG